MTTDTAIRDLSRDFPQWKPWITVLEEVLHASAEPKWENFFTGPAEQRDKTPLLAGATLVLDTPMVGRWTHRLFQTACESGAPNMAQLKPFKGDRVEVVGLFQAALCQDRARLHSMASELGADPGAFEAVALLLPVPFLLACDRRWRPSISASWVEGYCPLCASWPALAEVRGIERTRYFRCGRCGGEWQSWCLFCPYCRMTDHNELVSLLPDKPSSSRAIDACKRCRGYVKAFTVLQGSAAEKVMLDDLASVDLDIAAVDQGYRRSAGTGCPLEVIVVPSPTLGERIFSWRA